MKDSIAEAVRSASAMEEVANATKNNAVLMQDILHKQMRAYISVDTGLATYQDAANRFAGNPVLNNNGLTPARNVSFKAIANIFTIENVAPESLQFPDSGEMVMNDVGLAPRQQFVIHGIVKIRYPDPEVVEIMRGDKRRLFVWGIVTYEDIFGDKCATKFCHSHVFFMGPDGKVQTAGYYHSSHNKAT